MEIHRTQNSQNNLEELSQRIFRLPDSKTIYKAIANKTVEYWQKDKQKHNEQNRVQKQNHIQLLDF